jgi:hypothetical protein
MDRKDHFPKMPDNALRQLHAFHQSEVLRWFAELNKATARDDLAAMARLQRRIARAQAAAERARISIEVRDQQWAA